MGGEPTFVSVDDMTSPQWTVAADGPEKRALANQLAAALADRFAQGGLVQRSQGKWYPGEALPRWQIGLLWRADGEQLWSDADAAGRSVRRGGRRMPTRQLTPRRLARAITADLGLPADQLRPCFEDPLARLAAEVAEPEGPRPGLDPAGRRTWPGRPTSTGPSRTRRLGAAAGAVLVRRGLGQPGLADPPRPAGAGARGVPGRYAAAAGLVVLVRPRLRRRGLATTGRSRRWARPPPGQPQAVVVDARGDRGADGPGGRRRATAACTSSCPRWRSWRCSSSWSACSTGRSSRRQTEIILEGYGPPPDPRIKQPDGHPRPRRDRGQRAPDLQLDRAGRAHPDAVRHRPAPAGWAPRPSRSTAGTAAPAAATTSPSAARSRASRRCCAARTCWSAC